MRTRIKILFLLLLASSACRKEEVELPKQLATNETITIEEARTWVAQHSEDKVLKKYPIQWSDAKSISTDDGNRLAISLSGQPTYQGYKQGYRQLSIQKNKDTKQIEGKVLEIIPDAIYFQGKRRVDHIDFTGRIFEYDLDYKLTKGLLYANGKVIGESRPATNIEVQQYNQLDGKTINSDSQSSSVGKVARAQMIETCQWVQNYYVDGEGALVIFSERFCTTYVIDDGGGGGYNDGGIGTGSGDPTGGGGGTSNPNPNPPPPSDLPQENKNNVDPKKMMDCFGNIPDANAVYQVKLLVQEPFPGTAFNVGPNSFGHVALSLTKSGSGQMTTQIIGYYPTGTGTDKLISKSSMKDNSDMQYNVSSTYYVNAENFQRIIGFVSNPDPNYHYTQFNCATFAYNAVKAGGISMPDPTTQNAFVGYAITPLGMSIALKSQKSQTGSPDISDAGGRAGASKGECK